MFRWLAFLALFGTLSVSVFYRRKARSTGHVLRRRQERGRLIFMRFVVALPLFGSVALFLISPWLMAWSSIEIPVGLQWFGAVLGVLCVPASWWVFRTIGTNISETVLTKPDHVLVTTGPYRWVRHPLYTTGIVLFASIGLMASNWFILALVVVVVVSVYAVVIPEEEGQLTEHFGDAYRVYRRTSGRLLPKLRV